MCMNSYLPATKLFLAKSAVLRRSMNTSASSIKRTASQLVAVLKCEVRFNSISDGSVPMSLLVNTISGRLVYWAIHSSFVSLCKCNSDFHVGAKLLCTHLITYLRYMSCQPQVSRATGK